MINRIIKRNFYTAETSSDLTMISKNDSNFFFP